MDLPGPRLREGLGLRADVHRLGGEPAAKHEVAEDSVKERADFAPQPGRAGAEHVRILCAAVTAVLLLRDAGPNQDNALNTQHDEHSCSYFGELAFKLCSI